MLYSNFPLATYFIHGNVYVSVLLCQLAPPSPSLTPPPARCVVAILILPQLSSPYVSLHIGATDKHYHFIAHILPLSPQPLLFLPKSWSFVHLSSLTPADVHLQSQIQKLYYTVTYCQSRALASGRPGWGFPGGASGKEPKCQCRRCKRRGFNPWVGKIPWRRTWPPTLVSLPGELHGQKSLVGYDL